MHNVNRKSDNLRMYEFGNVYRFDPKADASEKILAPYKEDSCVGLWITGNKIEGSWTQANTKETIFDLKGIVMNIFRRLGIAEGDMKVRQFSSDIYSQALEFTNRGGKLLGTMGIVKRAILKKMEIDQEVFYAELFWDAITKISSKKDVKFKEIPKSQPVKRDLALLIDSSISFADVKRVISNAERKLLKGVTLFDVYEGKNLEAGKKSYAVSMILQDPDKTLQEKEIEKSMSKIISCLEKGLGASLR